MRGSKTRTNFVPRQVAGRLRHQPSPMQLTIAVQACPECTPLSGIAPAPNPGADGVVGPRFPIQQACRRRPPLRRRGLVEVDTAPHFRPIVQAAVRTAVLTLVTFRSGVFDLNARDATARLSRLAHLPYMVILNHDSAHRSVTDLAGLPAAIATVCPRQGPTTAASLPTGPAPSTPGCADTPRKNACLTPTTAPRTSGVTGSIRLRSLYRLCE